ncbi:MAG TPA: ABC transporter permease, partial [Longimicrobiales bacterium]|nr:ABC transporter permease [Longimicrobiales bacterium]
MYLKPSDSKGGAVRAFRILLTILPPAFRRRFRGEMEAAFGQRLEEARRRGRGSAFRVWVRTTWDLAGTAAQAWPQALAQDLLWADLRHALRRLRTQPAFTVLAVTTAALGIGANTAVFSVVKTVLLDPLPVREPSRLVRVWSRKEALGQERYFVSPTNYVAVGERARTLAALGAWVPTELTILPDRGDPVRVSTLLVSVDLFHTLGVEPVVGRGFVTGDADPGPPKGVILSHAAWQEIFGGDPHVLEREIRVGGASSGRVPVIGVLPAGLDLPEKDVQIFLSLRGLAQGSSRFDRFLNVVARLAPGATVDGAQRELDRLARGFAREAPGWNRGWDYQV